MTPSFDQLPYTVLDTILGLNDLSLGYDADLDLRRLGKRTLNTYSMTCRLWCSRIRPRLFAIITLRSREDILSLLSFSVEAKLLIQDVIMEETIPGIPWTHLMYMAIRARGFSPKMSLRHQFNGAPTCLAHPLQPFNHSLPRILPAFVKDQSPISLSNLVLPSFNDLLVLTSRLCPTIYWELDFSDVSWLAGIDCIGVPASATRKNRALCSLVGMRSCAERWPFVWLCITTCPPQPNRALYVDPGEVPTLMRLTECLTTPTDGRVCGHTELYRNDSARSPSAFALSIRCMELPPHNCTPTTRFHFHNGRLEKVRLELVAPEEGGFALTLHDWEQFDSLCAGCEGLQEVRIQVDGDQTSVNVFVKEVAGLLRRLVRQGKVVFVS